MPLVLHKAEWDRLSGAARGPDAAEAARGREYLAQVQQMSDAMTKTWPNSLENVRKRNEELRQARQRAAEQANSTFYRRYLTRRREDQDSLMYSARDTVFKNKDAPKWFLSAVMESMVQAERGSQLSFRASCRQQAAERRAQDDAAVLRRAADWHDAQAERRRLRRDADKKHQQEIVEQAAEAAERERRAREEELRMQRLDNQRGAEEMAAIRKFEEEFRAREKARIFADMQQAHADVQQRRRERAARAAAAAQLDAVLRSTNCRVEARRRQTEKESKEERARVLAAISARLSDGSAAREAAERAARDRAARELEAKQDERRLSDEAKRAAAAAERRAERRRDEAERARRDADVATTRQWELVNRWKNEEVYKQYLDEQKQIKDKKVAEFREDALRLWSERSAREAAERADRAGAAAAAAAQLRADDDRLLAHADALLREAAARGWPTGPIERTRDRYCRMHRLYPANDLPRGQLEHFPGYAPRDHSRPRPGYVPPAAPVRTIDPDKFYDSDDEPAPAPAAAPAAAAPAPPRGPENGIQDLEKPPRRAAVDLAAPAAPVPRQKANGLQTSPQALRARVVGEVCLESNDGDVTK